MSFIKKTPKDLNQTSMDISSNAHSSNKNGINTPVCV
jgi:hypothetical protein